MTAYASLQKLLAGDASIIGFVDAGRVREPAQPWGPAYRGKGLALAWTLPEGASLRATWARRIGRNPSPQPDSGRDRDGTLELNRLWLNALWAF